MKFVIEDSGDRSLSSIPQAVQAMLGVLKRLPDGKLLSRRALADRIGYAHETLLNHTAHPAMLKFKFKPNTTSSYFGNAKTIAIARREFTHETH